jgi:hypothetical protein
MKRMMNSSLGVNVMDPQGYDSFEGSQIGQALADALGFSSNVRQAMGDAGWAGADQATLMAALGHLMGREQDLRQGETARDLANARVMEQLGIANRQKQIARMQMDRMLQAQDLTSRRQFDLESMREKNAQAMRQMGIKQQQADKQQAMQQFLLGEQGKNQRTAMEIQAKRDLERSPKIDPMFLSDIISRRAQEAAQQLGVEVKQIPPQIYEQIVQNVHQDMADKTKPNVGGMQPQPPIRQQGPAQPTQPSLRERLWADQQSPLGTYGPMYY